MPFVGTGHWVQLGPQALGPSTVHVPLHITAPLMHATPHAPFEHVAVALAGEGHGVHDVPHVSGLLFDAQIPPQTW
jgi:hypothetical protein